jgi:hypothetical protein
MALRPQLIPQPAASMVSAGWALAAAFALVIPALALTTLPVRAAEADDDTSVNAPASEVAPRPMSGEEEVISRISPVDACNRAQGLRPPGAIVTGMHYERRQEADAWVFSCRVSWSTAEDARPTGRPILFGPTS